MATIRCLEDIKNKNIKEGDTIIFYLNGFNYNYTVYHDHLNIFDSSTSYNQTIFAKLGIDDQKYQIASKYYGYSSMAGDWPYCKKEDYNALKSLICHLYTLIDDKESKTTKSISAYRKVTIKNVEVDSKVVRGQDWDYDNQDAESIYGIVTEIDNSDSRVQVQWLNEDGQVLHDNSYRVGDEGLYDLFYYEEKINPLNNLITTQPSGQLYYMDVVYTGQSTQELVSNININKFKQNEVLRSSFAISRCIKITGHAISGRTVKTAIGIRHSLNTKRGIKLDC
jgi:hypothetical protein